MTGGIIQLVAYGNQDIFLTQDPQITFFKIVYRRYTNFTMEQIPQNFLQKPDFNTRTTCVLSRNGDLIRKIYIVAELPTIPQFKDEDQNIDAITKFSWVKKIGYAMINNIEVEIGGEIIDRHYGDWLNIWSELTVPNNKELDKIIGNVSQLTDPTNGKKSYKLMIPLQFWFNRVAGLSLPIVSLQYDYIKINLELNPLQSCYIVSPTHFINMDNAFVNFTPYEYVKQTIDGVTTYAKFIHYDIINRVLYLTQVSDTLFTSLSVSNPDDIKTESQQKALLYERDANGNYINGQYFITGLTSGFIAMPRINSTTRTFTNRSINFNTITLKSCFLLVEYIFLDDEERIRFSRARHEYLIEQLFYNGEESINGLYQAYQVGFTQACKELVWITQLSLAKKNNDYFNYTDSLLSSDTGVPLGKNIVHTTNLLFNGHERISQRDAEYYTLIQRYQNHTTGNNDDINIYSFALHPEEHQPSGSANFSKIDDVRLGLTVTTDINFNNTALLRIYGVMYNIFRVSNGISGVVFNIDY